MAKGPASSPLAPQCRRGVKAPGRGRGCCPPGSPSLSLPGWISPGLGQAMECCVDGCLGNQGLLGGCLLGVRNTVSHHPPSERKPSNRQENGRVPGEIFPTGLARQAAYVSGSGWQGGPEGGQERVGGSFSPKPWILASTACSRWEIIAPISQMKTTEAQKELGTSLRSRGWLEQSWVSSPDL